jgi:hypothetical protein
VTLVTFTTLTDVSVGDGTVGFTTGTTGAGAGGEDVSERGLLIRRLDSLAFALVK